jgi:cytochrome P450
MYSIPHWNFIPLVKTAKRAREEVTHLSLRLPPSPLRSLQVHNDLFPIIQMRREQASSQLAQDCLTALVLSGLTDAQIFDHCLTLICSAHDPVAYTASFVCLMLAENIAVQDRLRIEIFEALGARQDLTLDDVTGIKYLNQVSPFSSSSAIPE